KPISKIRLQAVTPPIVQTFYTELQETQSVEMVRKVHRFLHSAFEKARRIGLLSVNAVSAAEPPKRTDKKDIETFSPEEVAAIYDAAKQYSGGKYYPFIMLAFASGARLGELLGLCWDCVDFDADEITLRRNLTDTLSAGLQLSTPKTKAGIRAISIPPTVMALLRDIKRTSDVVTMRGYVFITSNGTPFLPRNFQRIWSNIVKLSGIPHKNFHVIRHTHATELLAAGAPIADVSRRLGHSKISHTLDLYGHAIPRMDKVISQKVSSIFSI
ncbi:MAG: site-specific integrase, partial [Schwartzia sp.]|nr:site-specific integrase [Schwartzia sp. (in: firmicutes)]